MRPHSPSPDGWDDVDLRRRPRRQPRRQPRGRHVRAGALPFHGRNGRRNAAIASTVLFAAAAAAAFIQPAAAVLCSTGGWLCILLYLAWQQGGLRWASAVLVGMAMTATAAFTVAQTETGQKPAQLVSARSMGAWSKSADEARDCLARWFTTRKREPGCLWGRDTVHHPPPTTTTRPSAGAGEPAP